MWSPKIWPKKAGLYNHGGKTATSMSGALKTGQPHVQKWN